MKFAIFLMLTGLFYPNIVSAQPAIRQVKGEIFDATTGEPLRGVNIILLDNLRGTITDENGQFIINMQDENEAGLRISMVGYKTVVLSKEQLQDGKLKIELAEDIIFGDEVVVSASRVEENLLNSPVSIEKMNILDIKQSSQMNFFNAVSNLKGVDVASSSILFPVYNSRGFYTTGNERFIQMVDGVDLQAPGLNFPVGNISGPTELDLESIEFIPGAASALYGPNAFNGILLMKTKDPFFYQGLSAQVKTGVNHIGGANGAKPLYQGAIRYAKAFNDKFAFKVNFSYQRAEDWYGLDSTDISPENQGGLEVNPGYNGLHRYGDEAGTNLALLRGNNQVRDNLAFLLFQFDPNFFGNQIGNAQLFSQLYTSNLPVAQVNRTPYDEQDLVDNYNTENLKINTSLHYRINKKLEAIYNFGHSYGSTVYTGSNRYALRNFTIQQHRLELKGSNFFLRSYATLERSGDSYDVTFNALNINNEWKDNTTWFGTYAVVYALGLAQVTNGNPNLIGQIPDALASQLHQNARNVADEGRFQPGSDEFETSREKWKNISIPGGAKFNDQTNLYHAEGQYNFSKLLPGWEVVSGANVRIFDLYSNGTIFPDTAGNPLNITEFGGYVQAGKWLADEKVKLTGSLRFDKNQNFKGQFSPRLSSVFKLRDNHTLRLSYQTGFRLPTTQEQHIDLNIGAYRLLGGLPQYADAYNVTNNAYTIPSIQDFQETVFAGEPNLGLLEPYENFESLQPEKVRSFEAGYRGVVNNNLMFDASYYFSRYLNFISATRVRKAAGPVDATNDGINNAFSLLNPSAETFQIYTNASEVVQSQGASLGIQYRIFNGIELSGNYNWNQLVDDPGESFITTFNTPEHKVNLAIGHRKITQDLGFNVTWRWQSAFDWESSFAFGEVPSYQTLDAQVNYYLKAAKTTIKIGGSNLTNQYYIQNYGGPSIGAIYYLSLTLEGLQI